METIGRRDVAAEVRAVPMSVRGQFLQQFKGKMSILCLALFFFRCTRDDVSSVCFRVGSIAKWRIVPFSGEGFTVFCSNKHFVWCAVRSAARKHIVGYIVSTYSIGYVFSRVLISSATGCYDISCCMQGTPTEHFSSMFMCTVFLSRLTPTVEPMTAGTHRCYYYEQDATETWKTKIHDKTVRSSKPNDISEKHVEHNTPHSHSPICGFFVSPDLSCDPC